MRKLLALVLTVILLVGLCACNGGASTDVKDTAISDQKQRQIYYEAVTQTCMLGDLGCDISVSCTMIYPKRQNDILRQASIEKSCAEYHAVFADNDKSFDCFYLDGYIYSDESGGCYKAQMTEDEFDGYISSRVYTAVGAEFANIAASQNNDNVFVLDFAGMTVMPEAFEKLFYTLGMSNCVLCSISGKAEIDESGYLISQSVTAELNMTDDGEAVTALYNAEVSYSIDESYTVFMVDDADYTEIDDIDAPILLKNSYTNIMGCSYDASYKSLYSYRDADDEYSMELDYSIDVSELANGFEADDETVIVYDTKSGKKDVKKNSEYKTGIYNLVNGTLQESKEMSDSSARSMYNHMLLDYEPEPDVLESISICDTGDRYEIVYEYSEYGVLLYCQNVLTVLTGDQEGVAVHAENYTVLSSKGTIVMDKKRETLLSHEINISVQFNDNDQGFVTGFYHVLNVEIH